MTEAKGMPPVHLMEPYRSALLSAAFRQGFVSVSPLEAAAYMPSLHVPQSVSVATTQLLLLFEDITTVWSDSTPENVARGLPNVTAAGLSGLGIARLVSEPTGPVEQFRGYKELGCEDWFDVWRVEQDQLDIYEALILSQLQTSGKGMPFVLYRLLRAYRLREPRRVLELTVSMVPQGLLGEAKAILELHRNPRDSMRFDVPVMCRLQELRQAHSLARDTGRKMAIDIPETSKVSDSAKAENAACASELFGIVAGELLSEGLVFPVPERLPDVIVLRALPEMRDFRQYFFPWLHSLMVGDAGSERDLRRGVHACVKAFQRAPVVSRAASIMGVGSLALGAVEAVTHTIGPSIATGLVSLGLSRLAAEWKALGAWVSLCVKPSNRL